MTLPIALLALCATASVATKVGTPFRPPAVPLAVSSPFFSIWSFDAGALATQTLFWHGDAATLDSLVRVDNKTYTLMGAAPFPPAAQQGFPAVHCLTSTYAFSAGGVDLTLAFTTPQLPGNWEALSRQATYVQWTAASADGAPHAVQVLLDASAEIVTGGFAGEQIEWDRPAPGAQRLGLVGQRAGGAAFNLSAHMRASTEPHQRMDYGFLYLLDGAAAPAAATTTSLTAQQSAVHAAFAASGALPGAAADAAPPAALAPSNNIVAARAYDLPVAPSGAPSVALAILLCDEVGSILNYDTILPGLWRKELAPGDSATVPLAALGAAVAQGSDLLDAAAAFDAAEAAALTAAGGARYAAVAQLVYRQVLGANAVAWNGSAPWVYQKEVSSDGDLSTLDVIFPSAPLLLRHDNASLLRAALEPPLYLMAGFNPSNRFTQPCALHSLGKWPVVEAGNGGCSMPMESTGDMLLMVAGVTQAQGGDGAWAAPYMPLLRRFAGFCASALPFPAPQDMSDDFSHAPGNLTNLALKCILGVAAQAYSELAAGNSSGAAALGVQARAAAGFFMQHAWSSAVAVPHFRFIYNESWADSSGLMYNAFWARHLGVEGLFPNFSQRFADHYTYLASLTANATWCLPLSSMEHDSKWDWLMHTAALMYTNGTAGGYAPAPSPYSSLVIDQLYTFANTTSSRFPLTDHPECTGKAPPAAAADRARPVMGALWAPLLIADPSPSLVQERASLAAFLEGLEK